MRSAEFRTTGIMAVPMPFAVCLIASCFVALTLAEDAEKVPVGHLQKLGSHRPMEGRVEELQHVPHPIDFYEQYSAQSKPVILKGAARDMPAFKLWTDGYMKERYGGETVAVEPGKKENRTRVALEAKEIPFGEFLDKYNTSDVYMVDGVPKPMKEEMMMLKCVLCGRFTEVVSSTNMWFSSGGTKSVLHNDDADNINCILSGKKEFFMAHKKYEPTLPFSTSGHVPMDVDAVDLIETPQIKEVKWWLAEIEAGDCLFIPHYWLHQVRSSGRNLAVNLWWHFFRNFNYTDCLAAPVAEGADQPVRRELPQYRPFSQIEISEGEFHRKKFIETMFQHGGKKPIELDARSLVALSVNSDTPSDVEIETAVNIVRSMLVIADKNKDKKLNMDEMYSIDADFFITWYGESKGGYNVEDVSEVRPVESSEATDNEEQEEGEEQSNTDNSSHWLRKVDESTFEYPGDAVVDNVPELQEIPVEQGAEFNKPREEL